MKGRFFSFNEIFILCKPLAAPYPPSGLRSQTEIRKKTDKKNTGLLQGCQLLSLSTPPTPHLLIPTPPTHAAGPHLQVVDEPRVVKLRLLCVDGLGVDTHLPVGLRVDLHPEKIRPRGLLFKVLIIEDGRRGKKERNWKDAG